MCKHFGKRLKVKGIKKPENQSTFLSFRVAKLRIFSQSYKFYAHKFEICKNYSFKTLSLFFFNSNSSFFNGQFSITSSSPR